MNDISNTSALRDYSYVHRVVASPNGEVQRSIGDGINLVRPKTAAIELTNFAEYQTEVDDARTYYLENENLKFSTANGDAPTMVGVPSDQIRGIFLHEVMRVDRDTGEMRAHRVGENGLDLTVDKVPTIMVMSDPVQRILEELDEVTRQDLEVGIIPRLIQSYLNEPGVVAALQEDDILSYLGFQVIEGATPVYLPTLVSLISELHYFFSNALPLKVYQSPEGSYELVFSGLQSTRSNREAEEDKIAVLAFVHAGLTIKELNEDNTIDLEMEWSEENLKKAYELIQTGKYRRALYQLQFISQLDAPV